MRRKTIRQQIIELRRSEPDLVFRQIADRLSCRHGYVQRVCSETKMGKKIDLANVLRLGYAADRAGLTVEQINAVRRDMAEPAQSASSSCSQLTIINGDAR